MEQVKFNIYHMKNVNNNKNQEYIYVDLINQHYNKNIILYLLKMLKVNN